MDDHLNLYYIFYTVANTENISRAARKLFITQPSISKSINRLENELNTQLFIRTSRGVRLTDEGRVLYEHVSKAFDVLQKGEQQLQSFIGWLTLNRYVNIGVQLHKIFQIGQQHIFAQCCTDADTQLGNSLFFQMQKLLFSFL